MAILEIKDLVVSVNNKQILNGVNLKIASNEVHVILGPNGTGKSTLAQTIMGHPNYEIVSGQILLDGEDVIAMTVDERAKNGLFLGMQYPQEISGITNADFIREAQKSLNINDDRGLMRFIKDLNVKIEDLKMQPEMAHRYLNEGFSGGEKKRNEILQMAMLNPQIAMLDEIDSGLDVDALNIVGDNLTKMMQEREGELGLLLITHYQRLLDTIKPTHVHIMMGGKIVKSGDFSLVAQIEKNGYSEIIKEG